MVKAFLDSNFVINNYSDNTIKIIEDIEKYIDNNDCPDLHMDISHLNVLDASKVTVLCSTYHWAKYPEGKINWVINSSEIKEIVKPMNLGNINLTTAQ